MFKKTLLLAGISTALISNAASANGLTLVSKNVSAPIAVYCHQKKGLYDIQPNNQLGPLPWVIISAMFGSSNLQCSFKLDDGSNTTIGTVTMALTATAGTIQKPSIVNNKLYKASANHDWGTNQSNMTVTLEKIK